MSSELESSERILKASEKILEASEKMSDCFKKLAQALLKNIYEPEVVSRSSVVTQARMKVQTDDCLSDREKIYFLEHFADPNLADIYLSFNERTLRRKWLESEWKKAGKFIYDFEYDYESEY
ncbi:hypothetical protein K3495_g10357 [Podosphaera aphanis]|nr:hypothetical protein K3495_g10357 [Podosphaera aphanis]